MKITRGIVKQVKAFCREACGGRRKVEIGTRHWDDIPDDHDGFNMLVWGENNDLDDVVEVDRLVGRDVIDDHGWVALDCYCYNLPLFGREPDDYLDTNVYVLIAPDGTVHGIDDERSLVVSFDAILKAHGHPGYHDID